MITTLMREKRGIRLLLCLVFAAVLTACSVCTGYGESVIREINSSGNTSTKLTVNPFSYNERFSAVLYNNRNGLPTSEANAIAQTGEGFLWIGSYSGLVRYDGCTFERTETSAGITNVRCLYVDSRDRLWVGTNDSGLFLMDKGKVQNWSRKNGLKSISIRSIAEGTDGYIYIGTTAGIIKVDTDLNLSAVADVRITAQTIRDLRLGSDGLIYGLTDNGDLFTMRDSRIQFFLSHEECRIQGILAILPDPKHPGNLYVGTDDSTLYSGSLERNFASLGKKSIAPLYLVERFEAINGQIWICAGNGIGKVDSEGFHLLENVPMNNSIGHVITDYEGNLWFTSTRQGIMKIVRNQFSDLSERYNLPEAVVNSTCMYNRQLFIGTDTGLIVIENDRKAAAIPLTKAVTASGEAIDATDLLKYLNGVRIRSIILDSQGRLWISTWRKYGLLCYENGELIQYTPEDGIFSDKVRVVSECEDGSILAAVTGGVNIIRDGRVTTGYGAEAGISNVEILTVTEGFNREILLGSDGGGIFAISEGRARHIGTNEGLRSEIILRIKRSSRYGVYWIVTGNSLAYMTPDYQVTTIKDFPYSNNYDLYENSSGDVWVISSNGIYEISGEELLSGGPMEPMYLGIGNGLPYVGTANSYSELTKDGDLYIAGTMGVVKVNIDHSFESIGELKVALPYIEADGIYYFPDENGKYNIPGNVHKLTIYPRVFSHLLINPLVSFRLDGFDSIDTTVSRENLDETDYTNLPNGTYQFIIRVQDPAGNTDKTVSYQIVKGKETSVKAAGSIILDIASLFFMAGILIYTSLYRKRGRLDGRLFFAMTLTNMIWAVSDLMVYLLEGSTFPGAKFLLILGTIIFYVGTTDFTWMFLLYMEYRLHQNLKRLKIYNTIFCIPCVLLLAALIISLKTGWIFTITEDNIFHYGPYSNLAFLPAAFYMLLAMIRIGKMDIRLVFLGILIIAVRIILGIWIPEIVSTAFFYTVLLVCMYSQYNETTAEKEAEAL